MNRWRGALGSTVLLAVVIGAIGFRWAPAGERAGSQVSPTPPGGPISSATATGLPTLHSATSGFDVRLPRGWTAADESTLFSRRSIRLLVIGNRGTDVPYPPYQSPLPGQLPDWSRLASDRIVLELVLSAGPGGPSPDTESSFPLDWNNARPIPYGSGSTTPALSFQHLLRPLMLVAHIGAAALPTDVAELSGIVASLAPEPIPTRGEYRGFAVVGPLTSFPIRSVEHFGPSPQRAYGFYIVRGSKTVFAFLDSGYMFMGAMKPCPLRYDALSRTFVCEATAERWSRVGKQLTAPGYLGLAYHTAFVKDGLVLVGGGASGGGRNVYDEAVEFTDPIAPTVPPGPLTKSEILDRYSRLTSTAPIIRAAAKLVPADFATTIQVIPGAVIPAETRTVWIVAFAGDVHLPGSNESHGRWTIFVADPLTGGVITAACCGDGDWPPGFDQLPDLAAR